MKKAFFLAFLFLFLSCTNVSRKKKEDILQKLRSANQYEGSLIGGFAQKSELYEDAEELMSLCSDSEILMLLNDKCPVVKCYAAKFIRDRNIEADWYNILLKQAEDYTSVQDFSFCIISECYAGDFILNSLFSKKLTDSEQSKMKLELVKNQSKLNFANSILLGQDMSDELYAATREWALKGNESAIFSLAKYKKDEDLQLIDSLKDKDIDLFFKACQYNTRESLKPFLEEYMRSIMPKEHIYNEWASFYKLLADYHDDFTKKIFDMAFFDKVTYNIREYHLKDIYYAIKDYLDGFYDDYLKILWTKHNLVDKEIIDYFLLTDKEFALEGLKTTLLNSNEYFFDTETLDYIIKAAYKNKIDLTEYFARAIKEDSVTTLEIYMKNMDCVQAGNKTIVNAVKARLENESNRYVTGPLTKYLEDVSTEK
ncbi:MAG: hypothetical protein J6X67_13575 [Treponema sp.]|nr:hypothetical protein [Treponema sp.]